MRRRVPARGQRRKWVWEGAWWQNTAAAGNPTQTVTVAEAHTVALDWIRAPAGEFDTQLNDNVEEDCTLTRLLPHGFFNYGSFGAGFANTWIGAMGIIKWSHKDETIPALTAIPLPTVDTNFDWVWRWAFSCTHMTAETTGKFYDTLLAPTTFNDVRSQRKLSHGEGLLLIVDQFEQYHGANYNWMFGFNCRYGLKKP